MRAALLLPFFFTYRCLQFHNPLFRVQFFFPARHFREPTRCVGARGGGGAVVSNADCGRVGPFSCCCRVLVLRACRERVRLGRGSCRITCRDGGEGETSTTSLTNTPPLLLEKELVPFVLLLVTLTVLILFVIAEGCILVSMLLLLTTIRGVSLYARVS